jgi:hypothetical protein
LQHDPSLTDARQWLENLNGPAAAPGPQAPAHYGPAPSVPYGPGASAVPPTAPYDTAPGPQWVEPQLSPPQGAQRPAGAALPQVLRPNTSHAGQRYGMAPTGFEPPSQY